MQVGSGSKPKKKGDAGELAMAALQTTSNSELQQVFGLTQINVALETSAHMIGRVPAIVNVVGHELCKYLLQNTQATDQLGDGITILSLTLRVIFNLFNSSMKTHLKVQLEVFFNTIHLRIPAPLSEASFEKKELVLESVVEFCSEPELLVDLYCNYDVDLQSSSPLFEHLCSFVAEGCVAVAPTGGAGVVASGQPAGGGGDSGGDGGSSGGTGGKVAMQRTVALQRLSLDAGVAVLESLWQIFVNPASSYRYEPASQPARPHPCHAALALHHPPWPLTV